MTIKRVVVIIVAGMFVLLSSCNLKEKIGENITEGIIEKASDGEVDIDIDGDEVTYSTDEGEVVISEEDGFTMETDDGTIVTSGTNGEWPTDQAAAYIPKLEVGTLAYTLNGSEVCILEVEGIVIENYQSYEQAIMDAGYTEDKVESSAEDMELYSGKSQDGIVVMICFVPSTGIIQITVDGSEKTEKQ